MKLIMIINLIYLGVPQVSKNYLHYELQIGTKNLPVITNGYISLQETAVNITFGLTFYII